MKINKNKVNVNAISKREIDELVNVDAVVLEDYTFSAKVVRIGEGLSIYNKGTANEPELVKWHKVRLVFDNTFLHVKTENGVLKVSKRNFMDISLTELFDVMDAFDVMRFGDLYYTVKEAISHGTLPYFSVQFLDFLVDSTWNFTRKYYEPNSTITDEETGEVYDVRFDYFETTIDDFKMSENGSVKLDKTIENARSIR